MEAIKLTVEQVCEAYKNNNVNEKRIAGMNEKFTTVPDKFTVYELIFVDVKVDGDVKKNVPAFRIGETAKDYVLIGQLRAQHTDKTEATQITKDNGNKDKWLVVNNKYVNKFAENRSEAEFVAFCIGKTFKLRADDDTNYRVFSGKFDKETNKVSFYDTAKEALEMGVKPKSYRSYRIVED